MDTKMNFGEWLVKNGIPESSWNQYSMDQMNKLAEAWKASK